MANDDVYDDLEQTQSLKYKNLSIAHLTEKAPTVKEPNAFRTISEVSEKLHVPQHVLRFWESRFKQIAPLKRNGGRRYYRSEDIVLLKRISDLLYVQGYTVKGVQRMLENGELNSAPQQEIQSLEKNLDAQLETKSSDGNKKTMSDSILQNQLDTLKKRNLELNQFLQIVLEELHALRKTLNSIN
ncbi:hypothetical protein COMNV_00645 [Commensalibacter sp. Nvir]|uniref:MerR family transcriptional regulator n=1 Tax=Commensalibacter sp. Nvir TaxID=3069817 RepID=UPI002D461270|nr:hypothetical protein COMNV_00645 [Commensalibacter sp. Nvir]